MTTFSWNFVLGLHPEVLRAYSWLCTQVTPGSSEARRCLGSNPDQPHTSSL